MQNKFFRNPKAIIFIWEIRAISNSVVAGHSLIMDIDGSGIEIDQHKNSKSEKTVLAKKGLIALGIHSTAQNKDNAVKQPWQVLNH